MNSICRQLGTAFGIAFLGAILTSQYNGYIHDRVLALRPPASIAGYITPAVKRQIIGGIQQGGPIAGSLGLKGDPSHPNPYATSPIAPALVQIARAAFVDSTVTIIRIAVAVLVVGTLAALILVRRRDLIAGHGDGAPAVH